MGPSAQEMKSLLVSQFSQHFGNDSFEVVEENLLDASLEAIPGWGMQKARLEMTFVVPDSQEVWQFVGREKVAGVWRIEAFSFIGTIDLTFKQEQLLESSFNSVLQGSESDHQGDQALEAALDQHYSRFNSDQLELLNKLKPTSPNGVSFTPCQNSNASVLNWWIRAELETKEPDLDSIFQAGRFTTAFMREKLDSLKVAYSLVGFESYM